MGDIVLVDDERYTGSGWKLFFHKRNKLYGLEDEFGEVYVVPNRESIELDKRHHLGFVPFDAGRLGLQLDH